MFSTKCAKDPTRFIPSHVIDSIGYLRRSKLTPHELATSQKKKSWKKKAPFSPTPNVIDIMHFTDAVEPCQPDIVPESYSYYGDSNPQQNELELFDITRGRNNEGFSNEWDSANNRHWLTHSTWFQRVLSPYDRILKPIKTHNNKSWPARLRSMYAKTEDPSKREMW